jgi:hypothetical protein
VRVTAVRENGLIATLFEPVQTGRYPGILVLGGSEGGLRTAEPRAALLASRGYTAMALAYFGVPYLPAQLFNIPVESLERGIEWLQARDDPG